MLDASFRPRCCRKENVFEAVEKRVPDLVHKRGYPVAFLACYTGINFAVSFLFRRNPNDF